MLTLPKTIIHVLRQFEEVFRERVWEWAKVLLIGAILVPGERTVASILRVMGCSDEKQFQNYHRVLHRAKWSSRELSRRCQGRRNYEPIENWPPWENELQRTKFHTCRSTNADQIAPGSGDPIAD